MVKVSVGTKGAEFDWTSIINSVEEPPKGLDPIGDTGWYKSPDVVDPRDCENYPDSPWCGGNPIDPSLQIEVEVNVDPCGFTIKTSGSALIKTPTFTQTYRKPGECRREYEKPPPVVPPPPLPGNFNKPPDTPIPIGFGADEHVAVAIVVHGYGYERRWVQNSQKYATFTYDLKWQSSNIQCPSTYLYNGAPITNYGTLQSATSSCEFSYQYTNNPDDTWTAAFGLAGSGGTFPLVTYAIDARQAVIGLTTDDNGLPVFYNYRKALHSPNSIDADLLEGRFGDIFDDNKLKTGYSVVDYEGTDIYGTRYSEQIIDIRVYSVVYIVRKQNNGKKNPPPPPPDDKECCMQCCSASPQTQTEQQNNDLLRQILAECKKMNKSLGSDLFPAVFPAKLTGSGSGTVTLNNVAETLKQQVIYMDELVGEYPIKMKIEDTDAVEEGNQTETMEFGNTSEILAESFGILMNLALDVSTLVQMSTKNLIEIGITRKQLHATQSAVDALIAHTGFEVKETTEDVPFTFTVPSANNADSMTLTDFCKESTQKVEVVKFQGKTTYEEDRAVLRHAHGILKSVFWRGVAKDAADVGGAIRDLIKKQNDAANKIATGTGEELDDWIDDFETGYTQYTGGTTTRDPAKPYGLPLANRPRIQIIRKPGQLPPTT